MPCFRSFLKKKAKLSLSTPPGINAVIERINNIASRVEWNRDDDWLNVYANYHHTLVNHYGHNPYSLLSQPVRRLFAGYSQAIRNLFAAYSHPVRTRCEPDADFLHGYTTIYMIWKRGSWRRHVSVLPSNMSVPQGRFIIVYGFYLVYVYDALSLYTSCLCIMTYNINLFSHA